MIITIICLPLLGCNNETCPRPAHYEDITTIIGRNLGCTRCAEPELVAASDSYIIVDYRGSKPKVIEIDNVNDRKIAIIEHPDRNRVFILDIHFIDSAIMKYDMDVYEKDYWALSEFRKELCDDNS